MMKLDGENVTLKFGKYHNGNLALQVFDEEGFPYATITVNLYDELSNSNCAFIDTIEQIIAVKDR